MAKQPKEASLFTLINMCDKLGWDKGIAELEKVVANNENVQAFLFGGDHNQIKQAQLLSKTIIKQNTSIARLKQYRKENNL